MLQRGLEPEFSNEELEQLSLINAPASPSPKCIDLRSLLWCSIDNDDSRDLDQLTYVEKSEDGKFTLWIAVADVDALVKKDSPIDIHAQINTTSVYTPARIFTMLPEKLSTNLTSLNENEDRVAMVVKVRINHSGDMEDSSIFQATVHNYAQLTYHSIGEWLAGTGALPDKVKQVSGLESILKLQHEAAQILKHKRHEAGSLTLESSEAEVKIENDEQLVIQLPAHNFAHQLIEEFMIAANRAMAKHFIEAKIISLRRVVRIPKYWNRIVEVAEGYGTTLPRQPDSKALDLFLINRRKADPDSFPDLSLTIIKLLGRGEYVVENDPNNPIGHFALAITAYTHSTAPNRRFPDLISQRQYKAFLNGEQFPYAVVELYSLATHCTHQEDAAMKVQRQINKSAAAALLSSQIGKTFQGIITGINDDGTWVRIFKPAVEGKLIQSKAPGLTKLNIGDKVSVQLNYVNIPKGFIDFALI
ncbi:MAG: RNB domain-containing ribonuclease [Parachlamydiaceae bacterium]